MERLREKGPDKGYARGLLSPWENIRLEKGKLYMTRETSIITANARIPNSLMMNFPDVKCPMIPDPYWGSVERSHRPAPLVPNPKAVLVEAGTPFIYLGCRHRVAEKACFFHVLLEESPVWLMYWTCDISPLYGSGSNISLSKTAKEIYSSPGLSWYVLERLRTSGEFPRPMF